MRPIESRLRRIYLRRPPAENRPCYWQRLARSAQLFISIILLIPAVAIAAPKGTQPTNEQNPIFDGKTALARSQAAIGRTLANYSFVSSAGGTVQLDDLRGKPLVISLVYSSCYHTCPMTTRYLAEAVRKARDALGNDAFNVLTIGFDTPQDNPLTMASFAKHQGVEMPGWYFVSGEQTTIDGILSDVGFTYAPSPKGFDHLVQTTVVDQDGKIYVHVYGEIFSTPLLVEPLKRLVLGARPEDGFATTFVKGVRLFCTTYDPANDAYRFDMSYFIGLVIGGSIILGTAGYLVRDYYRSRRS